MSPETEAEYTKLEKYISTILLQNGFKPNGPWKNDSAPYYRSIETSFTKLPLGGTISFALVDDSEYDDDTTIYFCIYTVDNYTSKPLADIIHNSYGGQYANRISSKLISLLTTPVVASSQTEVKELISTLSNELQHGELSPTVNESKQKSVAKMHKQYKPYKSIYQESSFL